MTWTPTTINILDGAGNSKPIIAYTDGTNFSFAHPLLDNTGAIISPATAANQTTMITALGLLSTSALQTAGNTLLTGIENAVAGATPAGTNLIGKVGIDQTTPGTTNGVQINAAIPAGTNSIGAVTANAGTNLNTSALALDTSVNGLLVAQGSATSGQKGALVQAAVSTSAPTLTNGQTSPLSLDTAGNLRVVTTGGGSGGTSSSFSSAFPSAGTAIGAKNGASMVNLTADASGNLNVNLETALPAGANLIGKFGIDQTTPGTTNLVQLPSSQITTLTPPTTVTVTQATGTNLHTVIDSGTITTVSAVTAISNALPAGTNLMGKVGIDQTTPGTTNGVQVNAALPAGTNSIGTVVVPAAPVPSINSSSAYAHTASTTAYASGQLWANNATAGSVTFGTVSVAKANNQAFSIIGANLSKSGNSTTNAVFRVHLFNAAPTTAVADYGTFTASITAALTSYVGYIDFNTNEQFATNAQGIGLFPSSALSGVPVSGATTLYFVVEVRAAYTPVSAEALTLTLVTQ